MDIDKLKDAIKTLQSGMDKLARGPANYYLDCLQVAHDLLVNKYSPFLKGQRVELAKTLDISDTSGWRGSRHFLIEGSRGTVTDVEVGSNGLLIFVRFDKETYFDYQGFEKIPEKPSSFQLLVEDLRPIQYKPDESIDLFNG